MLRALNMLRRRESAAVSESVFISSSSNNNNNGFEEAIRGSREAIATLDKRHAHILRRAQAQSEAARICVAASDRSGAMLALQRRRLLLKDLQQLAAARLTLEKQLLQLEAAQTQKVAVSAMAAAAQAQKALSKQLNTCTVERLLDDLTEQQEAQQDLAEALQQNATPAEEEVELLQELQELEAFEVERQLLEPPAAATAAATPGATKARQQSHMTQYEGELLRLQQQLQLQQHQEHLLHEPVGFCSSQHPRETAGLLLQHQPQQQHHVAPETKGRLTGSLLEQLQQQQLQQQPVQQQQQQYLYYQQPHSLQHPRGPLEQQHRKQRTSSPVPYEVAPLPRLTRHPRALHPQLLQQQQHLQQQSDEARLGVLLYS